MTSINWLISEKLNELTVLLFSFFFITYNSWTNSPSCMGWIANNDHIVFLDSYAYSLQLKKIKLEDSVSHQIINNDILYCSNVMPLLEMSNKAEFKKKKLLSTKTSRLIMQYYRVIDQLVSNVFSKIYRCGRQIKRHRNPGMQQYILFWCII